MPTAIEILNRLLRTKNSSLIRFVAESAPHLGSAGHLRRPLREMLETNRRQVAELVTLIDNLGGEPDFRPISRDEQYLGYLTIIYLLPKLRAAKGQEVAAVESALAQLGLTEPAAAALLQSHLAADRADLEVLNRPATPAPRPAASVP